MRILIVTALALASCMAALADFSYKSTSEHSGGYMILGVGDKSAHYYYKGNRMKVDNGLEAAVFDLDAQTVTKISHKWKRYSVTKLGSGGHAEMPGIANVRLSGVTRTGRARKIGGCDTTEAVFTMEFRAVYTLMPVEMQTEMHFWLCAGMSGSDEYRAYRKKLSEIAQPAASGFEKTMANLAQEGVPVLQTQKERRPERADRAQLPEMTAELSDFSTAEIPDAEFAVPAGYKNASAKSDPKK